MPGKEHPTVIDGFSSVQALRRTGKNAEGPRFRETQTRLPATDNPPPPPPDEPRPPAARIGRTIMPAKFDIHCYECGYQFLLQGHVGNTPCPKCHKQLDARNVIIDGTSAENIRTIGIVEITPGGILDGGHILARHILLAGDARKGTLQATQCLELYGKARFNAPETIITGLTIRTEAQLAIPGKITCATLEVLGAIRADITAQHALIRPGGFFQGTLHTPHLTVEDGGGLSAKVFAGAKLST